MRSPSPPMFRWPLGGAIVCLAVGIVSGSLGSRLWQPGTLEHAQLLQVCSETALAVCLFCVGLRMRLALEWRAWRVPVRLAMITMPSTIALIAAVANIFFDLDFAQALLLGAILAPTDPVLAADVQLPPGEEQALARSSLIAEGALSSGLAFPAVLFALGMLGLYDPGPAALRWVALDVLWAIFGALILGWLLGAGLARCLVRLDTDGQIGLPEGLLVLSFAAIAYGGAHAIHVYGFFALLAMGFALARGGRLRGTAPAARLVRTLQGLSLIHI